MSGVQGRLIERLLFHLPNMLREGFGVFRVLGILGFDIECLEPPLKLGCSALGDEPEKLEGRGCRGGFLSA